MRVQTGRVGVVFVACAMAGFLALASTAWACYAPNTQPRVSASPNRAAAGARVTVSGHNWAPATLTVRWGSPAGEPSVQATPSQGDGSFTLSFQVPEDASSGVHYIYVVQENRSPTKATAVEVLAPRNSPAPTTEDEPAPTQRENSTTGGTASAPEAAAEPEPQASPAGAVQSAEVFAQPTAADQAQAQAQAKTAPAAAPAPSARVRGTTPARSGASLTDALASAPAPVAPNEEQPAPAPSRHAASGDGWPGFSQGLNPSASPGLTQLPVMPSGPSQAMIGVGLLMAALVALFVGFGVTELGRRRTASVASNRSGH